MATTKVKFTSQSAWETQQQLNANFDDLDGRVDTLEDQIVNAGKVDDVKINGTSIVSSKEANFNTKSTYNSETNKIVTETDIADFATSTSVANTYVPQTRTINNKPLSTDISLSATDVGALSSETTYVSSVNGNSGAITGIATESFVNSSINSVTAYYITKNAQGAQFATVAELNSTTTFYSGGAVRVPTRNDYCIVQSDENHSNSTTRYIYQNGWEFQYVVNETALTDAQIQALNSGITEALVQQIEENTSARHTHTNKSLLDTYSQTEANLSDAVAKKHSHNNKSILDATTASFTTEQQTKLAGVAEGANKTVIDSAFSSSSTNPVQNKVVDNALKAVTNALNNKVTIEAGKGLSSNDFTDTYKNKIDGIEDGAEVNAVDSVNGKTGAVVLSASDVGAVATSDIADNLTTEDATKVLSANQGKVLSDANSATNQQLALAKSSITALQNSVATNTEDITQNTANIASNTTEINSLKTSKLDASKANVDVMTDLGVTAQNDNVSLNKSYKNLSTQATSSDFVNMPLANETTSGLMSKADYAQIRDNTARIEQLEGQNIIRLIYTASNNPTASQIEAFVKAEGYTDTAQWSQIGVVVSGTNHIWRYYTNTTWTDIGVDTVNQFTNSIAGIIKGSATDGKVYAETDGTGSVYGWDALNTKVANNTSAIGTETTNRTSADETLQSNIDTVSSNLSNEITNRQTADTNLQTQITTNATNISNKMDKTNPTGSGSFKLNASSGTVGTNSVSINGLASGMYSTTLGTGGRATEYCSYCEGHSNQSSGTSSHAEGEGNKVIGNNSHVEGFANTVNGECQHVFGKANIIDNDNKYVEIVGNGNAYIRDGILYVNSRSNARTLDWNGNEYIKGNLQASGLTDGTTTKTMSEILAGGGMKLWRYED